MLERPAKEVLQHRSGGVPLVARAPAYGVGGREPRRGHLNGDGLADAIAAVHGDLFSAALKGADDLRHLALLNVGRQRRHRDGSPLRERVGDQTGVLDASRAATTEATMTTSTPLTA